MTLEGFVSIAEQATTGGAPIDAFQADAFRRNDVLFEQTMQALLASPFMPTGTDGDVLDPDSRRFVNAKIITVNTATNLNAGVPLIWMAREKIILTQNINAVGFGAGLNQPGDFGGSGGGGAGAGQACTMPLAPTDIILNGGSAGNVGVNLDTADAWKLSRIQLFLPWLKGGAAGSDSGGKGGGVVCLCAPTIELRGAAQIDARGENASANDKGGGGGGLVILIARQLINVNPGVNILTTGGTAAGGSGRAGGNGKYLPILFK